MDSMDPATITAEQIRNFVKLHRVGWRRAAKLMAPDATPEQQKKLGSRISSVINYERKKARKTMVETTAGTTPGTPTPSPNPPTPLPSPPTPCVAPAQPDSDDGLAAKLRHDLWQLETDMMGMRDKGSWQALVSATRERRNIRERLVELDALAEEEAFDPTDIDQIVDEILELPDDVLRHPKLIEAIEASRVH